MMWINRVLFGDKKYASHETAILAGTKKDKSKKGFARARKFGGLNIYRVDAMTFESEKIETNIKTKLNDLGITSIDNERFYFVRAKNGIKAVNKLKRYLKK